MIYVPISFKDVLFILKSNLTQIDWLLGSCGIFKHEFRGNGRDLLCVMKPSTAMKSVAMQYICWVDGLNWDWLYIFWRLTVQSQTYHFPRHAGMLQLVVSATAPAALRGVRAAQQLRGTVRHSTPCVPCEQRTVSVVPQAGQDVRSARSVIQSS